MGIAVEDRTPDDAGRGIASRRVLRPFVSQALEASPGPELLAGLMSLAGRDDLSGRESVQAVEAWTAMISFCTAGQLSAVLDVDRSFSSDGPHDRQEVP